MKKIEITVENAQKAFHQAGNNPELQGILRSLFGDVVEPEQPRDIKERVKSYEDACAVLGISPMVEFDNYEPDEIAYIKLKTIVKALNEGWIHPQDSETEVWWAWFWTYTKEEMDDLDESAKQDRAMISIADFYGSSAGFACSGSNYAPSGTDTHVGSRLCFKNRELAVYCGKQFINLWAEYLLIK